MKETVLVHDHGFVAPAEIAADHYILGAARSLGDRKVVMPLGHGWGKYKPQYETQNKNGVETMNCTVYGTENIFETLLQFIAPIPGGYNYSERYVGVLAGTTRGGNDPHKVAEEIRTEAGLIPESMLPFDDTIESFEEYYSPKPMEKKYLVEGQRFLGKYKLGHEWVFLTADSLQTKQEAIKDALQYSPVGVSVFAWRKVGDLYAKRPGDRDNHWVMLVDFVEGVRWEVFDHYDGGVKFLEWNYDFGFGKSYSIEEIALSSKKNWLQEFADALGLAFKTLFAQFKK